MVIKVNGALTRAERKERIELAYRWGNLLLRWSWFLLEVARFWS
ncbi:hypothetical protein GobsT_64070 [Gemmata obscuriglobus]|nr:hypothetical protein [Gemmata obscuriglobus]QEG31585.1 hypothetical protein GobsT_64070 [Gemmata obscuriglobus]VTS10927.1 unnamed protein product [Gemmata obscuriglobus UQM 2246]